MNAPLHRSCVVDGAENACPSCWAEYQRIRRAVDANHGSIIDCPTCKGRGFWVTGSDEWAVCPLCDGHYVVELPLPRPRTWESLEAALDADLITEPDDYDLIGKELCA